MSGCRVRLVHAPWDRHSCAYVASNWQQQQGLCIVQNVQECQVLAVMVDTPDMKSLSNVCAEVDCASNLGVPSLVFNPSAQTISRADPVTKTFLTWTGFEEALFSTCREISPPSTSPEPGTRKKCSKD